MEETEEEIETVIIETDSRGRLAQRQRKHDDLEKQVDEEEEEIVEKVRKEL